MAGISFYNNSMLPNTLIINAHQHWDRKIREQVYPVILSKQ